MCQSAIQWIVFCGMFHIFVQINRDLTMKRLLSSVALLITSSLICIAQTDESRHEVSVSYGTYAH